MQIIQYKFNRIKILLCILTCYPCFHYFQVTWDPYHDFRHQHPFNEVAYYCGCIKYMDVVEPYHLDRVLKQFGRVQTIPPLQLASIGATRGPSARDYHMRISTSTKFGRDGIITQYLY